MLPTTMPRRRRRAPAGGILATLFLGMFVMGSTELLAVGLLDLLAADLRVSIPAAGTLVTAYALGLAIGGPVLTAATIRLDRRLVLVGALALFAIATLAGVLSGGYGLFLVARVTTGALQGVYIAAAFTTGTAVVAADRAGRAIAVVMSGVTVSGALGVPLGTYAGQVLGWRGSFSAAAALALLALVATSALVPSIPGTGTGAAVQVRHAFAPPVLAVLGFVALAFASIYATLTYIAPFLGSVTGVSGGAVGIFLLIYGAAAAVGSVLGGRFADAHAGRTLVVGTVGIAASLAALHLGGAAAAVVALVLLACGLFLMGMAPSMQHRVVRLAGPGGAFAQSLPASAANVGIALGSLVGGVAVGGSTVSAAVVAGLVLAALSIPVAWATSFLAPPPAPTTEPAPSPERGLRIAEGHH